MSDIEDAIRAIVDARIAELGLKPAANDGPALVTIAAYAAARSISPSTVRAAIREGRLEAVKIGRATRVRADQEIAKPARPPAAVNDRWAAAAARAGLRSVR